jgi:predicted nucleotidyltransferase
MGGEPRPALSALQTDQVQGVIGALQGILGPALLAVFLHGSATTTGLRPESDIDLLALIERPMSGREREALLTDLLRLSPRDAGAADGPRRLEVMVFVAATCELHEHPAEAEFIYGEWLRKGFEDGNLPGPSRSADNTLVLAQAGRNAVVLFGEGANGRLPAISAEEVRKALRDAIPPLLDSLIGDERNVILTLVRMWWTAGTGDFASKDEAAAWASPQMPEDEGQCLALARRAYRGEVKDQWDTRGELARRTANYLRDRLLEHL